MEWYRFARRLRYARWRSHQFIWHYYLLHHYSVLLSFVGKLVFAHKPKRISICSEAITKVQTMQYLHHIWNWLQIYIIPYRFAHNWITSHIIFSLFLMWNNVVQKVLLVLTIDAKNEKNGRLLEIFSSALVNNLGQDDHDNHFLLCRNNA